MTTSNLKPCPFCQRITELEVWEKVDCPFRSAQVVCNWCMASGSLVSGKDEAIQAWNVRDAKSWDCPEEKKYEWQTPKIQ